MKLRLICLLLLVCLDVVIVKQSDSLGEHIVKKKIVKRKIITHHSVQHREQHKETLGNLKGSNGTTSDSDTNNLRYYLFVPLVGFIFIMTIVSIIGFFVMLFGSNGLLSEKALEGGFTSSVVKNNLTKEEYMEIVKLKQIIKERMRSNHKAAPGLIFK
jgi:hypothetical protein